jgi:macrolide transport system ATP-binding/permease protein
MSTATANPPVILMEGVVKRYPMGDSEIEVLHGVSLRVERGEFVAIVGPSGSGKTSLMNILGLMDTASGGRFELEGRDVSSLTPDQRAEARGRLFGFIFQRYNLLPSQSARENVELPGSYVGMSAGVRRERALGLLSTLGMAHRCDNRPNQLSGGEQQRVAVARALMNGGRVILADEPTGALDTARGRELMDRIHSLHKAGHTVILITHDPAIAEEAERVIRLVDGAIVSDRPGRPPADENPPDGLPSPPVGGSSAEREGMVLAMDMIEALRMAARSLRANLFRAFLTMLGVIIGVASVVAMLAVGEGSRRGMMQAMSRMGTNMLRVEPAAKKSLLGGYLGPEDVEVIGEIPHVREVIPRVFSNKILRYRDRSYSCSVGAVTPNYAEAEQRLVVRGGFFTGEDDARRAPVVVLGMKACLELFSDGKDPVGKYILVDNAPFLVIGVVTVRGGSGDGRDREDDVVFIPLSTGQARIYKSPMISQIGVQVDEFRNADQVSDEIRERLTRLHQQENFRIFNQAAMIEASRQTQETFRFLLGAVACVSLVVGGIGVMNIMLVNVVERTREIGVRMACGARSRDIQLQFLTEAVLVCLLGGVIGLLLGILVSGVLVIGDTRPAVTLEPLLFSFGSAFMTGVVFGFWPARKASRMDPVVALGSE